MNFQVRQSLRSVTIEAVIVAGFTGRDRRQVEAHVHELRAAGVPTPAQTPSFYLASPDALRQTDAIVTTHRDTSGEAEVALLMHGDEIFVSLASDHTDRAAEALDIPLSKLACPKIVARSAWPLGQVQGHWDELEIRSWIAENGRRVLYQEGCAAELLRPGELLAQTPFGRRPRSFVMLAGTLAALGGIRGSNHFWAELRDPRLNRSISLDYRVEVIAEVLREVEK